jgi:peptidoglycan-associated lipoprotein
MTMTRFATVAALLATLNAGLVGCGGKKPPVPAPAPPPAAAPSPAPAPPPSPPPPPPAPAPAPPTEEEVFSRMSLDDLNAKKPLTDAFFDLDRADLTETGRTALQKDAEWMKKWQSTKVTVEGHCDSRGTTEYNLALGERRAQAVKDYLASLGIGTDRVLTVSKGKEAPFCSDENEECWSQNRRGHFVVTAK